MNRRQSQPLLGFAQLLARCFGLAWLALLAASPAADAAPVRLENDRAAVEVDAATGGLLSMHDKELQATCRMSGLGFRLDTDRGTVTSSQLLRESHSPAARIPSGLLFTQPMIPGRVQMSWNTIKPPPNRDFWIVNREMFKGVRIWQSK